MEQDPSLISGKVNIENIELLVCIKSKLNSVIDGVTKTVHGWLKVNSSKLLMQETEARWHTAQVSFSLKSPLLKNVSESGVHYYFYIHQEYLMYVKNTWCDTIYDVYNT